MTLVDTSVWVDHLRRRDVHLDRLLRDGQVMCHAFVIGELACGRLRNRLEILTLFAALPPAPLLDHDEALTFLEAHRLAGTGLGWIDVHLVASAALAHVSLWTRDRRLSQVAARLFLT